MFWISDFSLCVGGPSVTLPNLSFLPHLEVGYIFWTNIHLYIVITNTYGATPYCSAIQIRPHDW